MRHAGTPGRRPLLAVSAILAGAVLPDGLVGAGQDAFITPQSELFTNVTVIDGRGGPPRPSSSVLVWGGRIRDIGTQGSVAAPEGTVVVDLSGSYLIPGFIDAHASPQTTEELRALLAAGITGVRDGATSLAAFEERGRGGFGEDPVPAVYVGGPVLEAGEAVRGAALESEAAAIAEVARQAADGAGFVSLASSVPPPWLVGVARAARRAEVPLWADRRDGGWLLALRAGSAVASPLVSGDAELLPESERGPFDALAEAGQVPIRTAWLERLEPHGPDVDRAVTALLSNDSALLPLLASAYAPLDCLAEAATCTPPSADERAALQAVWPKAEALVRTFHGHGVRLLVGSDAPRTTPWGEGFHREMQLLAEAGIPPLEVLGMATRNGATALGQLHERGTIEIGKRADFLVLEANPVADIRNARRISFVVIDGEAWRFDREGNWRRVRFN
ncbi:amidohydrolase family protein [Candidatus Palauibacter soopunensis]|uniref:amidohydrolase family protein n=1 Tax=Candidatus Palauibacter soopunensis TaxID=3056739 RepID=UPI0023983F3C|nr:amidohydrolase family protein [Candidatus Palauibacter soopunensis]MDE2879008.1 amidohydrolase family protein [Candidatus Palauibacter soopunensis]